MLFEFVASGEGKTQSKWWKDIILKIFGVGDDEEKEDKKFDVPKAFTGFMSEVSDDIPFLQGLLSMTGFDNITNDMGWTYQNQSKLMIPKLYTTEGKNLLQNLGEWIFNDDEEKRDYYLDKVVEYLGPAALSIVSSWVTGGGQAKKSLWGAMVMASGGERTLSENGDQLVYAVDPTAENWVKAILFGKSSLSRRNEYYASGENKFEPEHTVAYYDLTLQGMGNEEAYDLINEFRKVKGSGEGDDKITDAEAMIDYLLNKKGLTQNERAILYRDMVTSSEERKCFEELEQNGAIAEKLYKTFISLDLAESVRDKYQAVIDADLSEENKEKLWKDMINQSDNKIEDLEDYKKANMDIDDMLGIMIVHDNIYDLKEDGTEKRALMSKYIDESAYTKAQKNTIKDLYWTSEGGYYDKFVSAGLSTDNAYELYSDIDALKPEAGKEDVSRDRKFDVIVSSNLSDADKLRAASVVMTEMQYGKLVAATNADVSIDQFAAFYSALAGERGQKNVLKALDSLDKTEYALTLAQKKVIWNTYGWKKTYTMYKSDSRSSGLKFGSKSGSTKLKFGSGGSSNNLRFGNSSSESKSGLKFGNGSSNSGNKSKLKFG